MPAPPRAQVGSPEKRENKGKYSQCALHLVRLLVPDTPVQSIWTAQLREYYATRISEKAAPNTVAWEISTLSAIFELLRDNKLVTESPSKLVRSKARGLKFASYPRQPYLS